MRYVSEQRPKFKLKVRRSKAGYQPMFSALSLDLQDQIVKVAILIFKP